MSFSGCAAFWTPATIRSTLQTTLARCRNPTLAAFPAINKFHVITTARLVRSAVLTPPAGGKHSWTINRVNTVCHVYPLPAWLRDLQRPARWQIWPYFCVGGCIFCRLTPEARVNTQAGRSDIWTCGAVCVPWQPAAAAKSRRPVNFITANKLFRRGIGNFLD